MLVLANLASCSLELVSIAPGPPDAEEDERGSPRRKAATTIDTAIAQTGHQNGQGPHSFEPCQLQPCAATQPTGGLPRRMAVTTIDTAIAEEDVKDFDCA